MFTEELMPPPNPVNVPVDILRFNTCGSVDDGKSTLIGRLLWEASDLPEDTRANLIRQAGPDGIPDVSLLLDGLVAEREQGITIDIAWRYFDAGSRRFVVIDSPGHEQYTRHGLRRIPCRCRHHAGGRPSRR